jgi:superoxide dismutase, Fe-Mn family
MASLTFCADDYAALEPSISGKIMELHHKNHHNTYVNSYNQAAEKYAAAETKDDISAKIALQPLINFHGGGHINHTLFWENLAPKNSGGGEPPSGALGKAIDQTYGSLDGMKKTFNTALAGIQGSGWAWLVKDTQTGQIGIKTYAVRIIPPHKLHRSFEVSNVKSRVVLTIPVEPRPGCWPIQAPSRY